MKGSMMKFISAGCLLAGFVGFSFVACTDYVGQLEDEYSYLREEEKTCIEICDGDEDCEDACSEKEVEKPESSSSAKGSSGSSTKSSSSGKGSSSSGKGDSASSGTGDEGGEFDAPNPTCEEQAFTKNHALPLRTWGYIGYVIPLKITKGSVQELYLSLGGDLSGIQGPDALETYGVALGQVDASGNWQFGTEVLSKNSESAIPAFYVNYGIRGVYTYGQYVKFEFDTKGTFLEKKAGKTINVGVNFYAPGVKSDSSGFGFDYYSVPSSDSTGLYYAYEKPGCSVYVPKVLDSLRCIANSVDNKSVDTVRVGSIGLAAAINKGDTVVWSLKDMVGFSTGDSNYFGNFNIDWKFDNGTVVSNRGGKSSVLYNKPGSAEGVATIDIYGMKKTVDCVNYDRFGYGLESGMSSIEVKGVKASGCKCSVDNETVDVSKAEKATYTFEGCTGTEIIGYKWSNNVSPIASSNKAEVSALKNSTITAVVTVYDEDSTATNVGCPAVKAYDPYNPEYILTAEMSPSDRITFPANGTYNVKIDCSEASEYYTTTLWMQSSGAKSNVQMRDASSGIVLYSGEDNYSWSVPVLKIFDSCRPGDLYSVILDVGEYDVEIYMH